MITAASNCERLVNDHFLSSYAFPMRPHHYVLILEQSLRVAYFGFPREHAREAPVEEVRRGRRRESGAQTWGGVPNERACLVLLNSWGYTEGRRESMCMGTRD
ncbi:hypothetical protein EDB89DRAFT_1908575 [Lactarius sanguifluus]|nr:hypothetical protein EDB89DRAFT_1908575 [Lactarius sanguifluus]